MTAKRRMPRTDSERAQDSVTARVAAGGRRLSVVIGPDAARALERMHARDGGTATRVVERALVHRWLTRMRGIEDE